MMPVSVQVGDLRRSDTGPGLPQVPQVAKDNDDPVGHFGNATHTVRYMKQLLGRYSDDFLWHT